MGKSNTSKNKYWVGFDLGGTKMLAVVYNASLEPIGRRKRKTRAFEGLDAGLARIVQTIEDCLVDSGIEPSQLYGISVGAPGPLDPRKGVICDLPNLGWKNVKITEILKKQFSCPVTLSNDVDAGTYGEYVSGAAKGARCALGIFPGTGIGGACVYEGKPLVGLRRSCMEIGHIPIVANGRLCGCGNYGCLETVASRLSIASEIAVAAYRGEAPFILEDAGTDLTNIRSAAIARAIENGDTVVAQIVERAAAWLGQGIATAVNLLLPDVVVLGGGLVDAMADTYVDQVRASTLKHVAPPYRDQFEIKPAELGDDSVTLGAASWMASQVENKTT
jgi:glucokinase